jgi:hypothetical protein
MSQRLRHLPRGPKPARNPDGEPKPLAPTVLPILREGRRPIEGGSVAPRVTAIATLDLSAIKAAISDPRVVVVAAVDRRVGEAATLDRREKVVEMLDRREVETLDHREVETLDHREVETLDRRVAYETIQSYSATALATLDLSPTMVETAPHNLTRRSTEAAIRSVLTRTGQVPDFLAKLRFRRR